MWNIWHSGRGRESWDTPAWTKESSRGSYPCASINTWWGKVKKMEIDSSQCYPEKESSQWYPERQDKRWHKLKYKKYHLIVRENFFQCCGQTLQKVSQEDCRVSKPNWTWPSATSCRWPCPQKGRWIRQSLEVPANLIQPVILSLFIPRVQSERLWTPWNFMLILEIQKKGNIV